MFVLGNLISALANGVNFLLNTLCLLIIIRAFLSWVNPDPYNPIVQFLNRVTEPILYPIRRILPHMGIDISPLIAIGLIVYVIQPFIVQTLFDIGYRLR